MMPKKREARARDPGEEAQGAGDREDAARDFPAQEHEQTGQHQEVQQLQEPDARRRYALTRMHKPLEMLQEESTPDGKATDGESTARP